MTTMSYLVVLVVNNLNDCPAILDAWEQAGVTGVTILESTGLGHIRRAGLRDDMPIIPSLHNLFQSNEVHHRTLLSVVDDQTDVDRMVEIARQFIGNLDDPHTGFLFVVPVLQVYGMGRHRLNRAEE
jgi:nitrogen regulatory protein P-II 1